MRYCKQLLHKLATSSNEYGYIFKPSTKYMYIGVRTIKKMFHVSRNILLYLHNRNKLAFVEDLRAIFIY